MHDQSDSNSLPASFLILSLLVAAALRTAAATGPLWLDEIWSLELASQAKSAAAVLTETRADNNHVLNTLYLRAVGLGRNPIVYRLPAVAFGTAAVFLGTLIASRWGRTEAVIASTLLGSSYLLVHYSSEARGYSPAIFFALLGCEVLLRNADVPRWQWIVTFWGSGLLGLLSHPIYIHFLVAVACWSFTVLSAGTADWRSTTRQLAVLFGIPALLAGVVYWSMWRHLDLGGGPAYSLGGVLLQTGSLALGGPANGWSELLAAILVVGTCGLAIWQLREDRFHSGLLLMLLILVPVAMAMAVRPPFLFPRYFLIAVLAVPFGVAVVLGKLFRHGQFGRFLAASLLLACIGANLLHVTRLVNVGRGQYLEALNHMARTTDEGKLTLTSDHSFGVQKLIAFYAPQMLPPCRVEYHRGDRWPTEGPDWLILHRTAESSAELPGKSLEIDGHRFQLDRMFDCSILSGWQWWCYRQEGS
jgi:hypothetical protein